METVVLDFKIIISLPIFKNLYAHSDFIINLKKTEISTHQMQTIFHKR